MIMTAQELKQILMAPRFLDYDQFAAAMDFGCEPEAFTKWLEMQKNFQMFFLYLDDRRAEIVLKLLSGVNPGNS